MEDQSAGLIEQSMNVHVPLAATDPVLIGVPCFGHMLDVCAGDGFKKPTWGVERVRHLIGAFQPCG